MPLFGSFYAPKCPYFRLNAPLLTLFMPFFATFLPFSGKNEAIFEQKEGSASI